MIFDCFIYYNEMELLELRLNTLNHLVDYFVLVESNKTFTNKDKEFHFENNKDKFQKFLDRIIHVKVEDAPGSDKAWVREAHQRNCIMRGLKDCRPDDLIIISDVDEIPNPRALNLFLQNRLTPRVPGSSVKKNPFKLFMNLYWRIDGGDNLLNRSHVVFEQDLFYYFVNCKTNAKWRGSILTRFKNISLPARLRDLRDVLPGLPNGGWHFSYLGGADRIIDKIKAFSHTEMDRPEFTSVESVEKRIKNGQDLFCREKIDRFEFIEINPSFPADIGLLIEKYPYLYFKDLSACV